MEAPLDGSQGSDGAVAPYWDGIVFQFNFSASRWMTAVRFWSVPYTNRRRSSRLILPSSKLAVKLLLLSMGLAESHLTHCSISRLIVLTAL
jgi:hypothetical protein